MNQYLIDTHVLIWFSENDQQLPVKIKVRLEDPANRIVVSIVSLWEIVIKVNVGKLALKRPLDELILLILSNNIEILPIRFIHLQAYLPLPLEHKDPFDRLLIAQAIAENFSIITKDDIFSVYNVSTIW